jgi:uncharacterized membrane protein
MGQILLLALTPVLLLNTLAVFLYKRKQLNHKRPLRWGRFFLQSLLLASICLLLVVAPLNYLIRIELNFVVAQFLPLYVYSICALLVAHFNWVDSIVKKVKS